VGKKKSLLEAKVLAWLSMAIGTADMLKIFYEQSDFSPFPLGVSHILASPTFHFTYFFEVYLIVVCFSFFNGVFAKSISRYGVVDVFFNHGSSMEAQWQSPSTHVYLHW